MVTLVSAVFAAGGAYTAVRVELRWLRRDIERLEARIEEHEAREDRQLRLLLERGAA